MPCNWEVHLLLEVSSSHVSELDLLQGLGMTLGGFCGLLPPGLPLTLQRPDVLQPHHTYTHVSEVRAGQGRAGQGRAGQGRAEQRAKGLLIRAGQGRAEQQARGLFIEAVQAGALLIRPCRAGQGRGQGRACTSRHGAMTDLGLLLSLQLVTVHLLLQVALGVLVDLDQINLLVCGMLSLSLELVQQITLTDEIICLLALPIDSTLQAVNLTLQELTVTMAMLVQLKSKTNGSSTYLISSRVFSTSDFCFSRVFSLAMDLKLALPLSLIQLSQSQTLTQLQCLTTQRHNLVHLPT
ncbi:MAG: hypothetical protein FRX49_12623 [Trebouxia sp. A1-2]|nr:MAG: hypothetical protein FRX49_12623 [Trebouxia sp. A1-2]